MNRTVRRCRCRAAFSISSSPRTPVLRRPPESSVGEVIVPICASELSELLLVARQHSNWTYSPRWYHSRTRLMLSTDPPAKHHREHEIALQYSSTRAPEPGKVTVSRSNMLEPSLIAAMPAASRVAPLLVTSIFCLSE